MFELTVEEECNYCTESMAEEHEAAAHSASTVRKEREMKACLSAFFIFSLAVRIVLPNSVNIL